MTVTRSGIFTTEVETVIAAVNAALPAVDTSGYGYRSTQSPASIDVEYVAAGEVVAVQAVLDGLGTWALTAVEGVISEDVFTELSGGGAIAVGGSVTLDATSNTIRVTGPDAACIWHLYVDGELVTTEVDTVERELLIENPVPGVYTITAIAADGMSTGDTTWTVQEAT